jgi:signal peptidase II
MKARFLIITSLSSLAVLVIDQLSKYLIIKKIPDTGIFLFNKALSFDLVYNPGISFGLRMPSWTIVTITIIMIAFLVYFIYNQIKQKNYFITLLISLVTAAAISNFADRVFRNGVVDFVSVQINGFAWPSFNFADAVITICAIILIILIIKKEKVKA